jgi:DNA-binding LytR/AlgR family response regulator
MKSNYFEQLIQPNMLGELKYLEANKNYTILHLTNGETKDSGYNLLQFEKLLASNSSFKRIHRSYIVNMNFVDKIDQQGGFLKLSTKEVFPLGKGPGFEDIQAIMN